MKRSWARRQSPLPSSASSFRPCRAALKNPKGALQVLAGTVVRVHGNGSLPGIRSGPGRRGALGLAVLADDHAGRDHRSGRQLAQLRLRGSVFPGGMLGCEGRLDAVEEALEPADQLRLGDPQLRVRRRSVLGEGKSDPFQFLDEFRGEAVFEFLDGAFVDVRPAGPAPRRRAGRTSLRPGAASSWCRSASPSRVRQRGPGAGWAGRPLRAPPAGRVAPAPRSPGLLRAPAAGPGDFSVVAGRQGVQGGALKGVPAGGLSVVRIAHGFILSRARSRGGGSRRATHQTP